MHGAHALIHPDGGLDRLTRPDAKVAFGRLSQLQRFAKRVAAIALSCTIPAGCSSNATSSPATQDAVIFHNAISSDGTVAGLVETIEDPAGNILKRPVLIKGVAGQFLSSLGEDTYTRVPAGSYLIKFTCSKSPPSGSGPTVLLGSWTENLVVESGQSWRLINRVSLASDNVGNQDTSEMERLLGVVCRPYLQEMSKSSESSIH